MLATALRRSICPKRSLSIDHAFRRWSNTASASNWWTIREDECLSTQSEAAHGEDSIVGNTPTHPALTQLRSQYPSELWHAITRIFPNRKRDHTKFIDIAIGSEGRSAVELNRRGFAVVGVEADASLLARTFQFAQVHNANIELVTAKVEHSLLHDNSADAVSFFHGLHLVNTTGALQEAYRLLKPGGVLVAAFNDRNISDSEFIRELEDIMEHHVISYNRWQHQHGIDEWGGKLQEGGMFKLLEYSVFKNHIHMSKASALIDVLDCFSFIRASLRGEARKRFNSDVRALLERRFGRSSFELPLETKMYVLRSLKNVDEEESATLHAHTRGSLHGSKSDADDAVAGELNCWSGPAHTSAEDRDPRSSHGRVHGQDIHDEQRDADEHVRRGQRQQRHAHDRRCDGGHGTIFSQ